MVVGEVEVVLHIMSVGVMYVSHLGGTSLVVDGGVNVLLYMFTSLLSSLCCVCGVHAVLYCAVFVLWCVCVNICGLCGYVFVYVCVYCMFVVCACVCVCTVSHLACARP